VGGTLGRGSERRIEKRTNPYTQDCTKPAADQQQAIKDKRRHDHSENGKPQIRGKKVKHGAIMKRREVPASCRQ